MAKRKLTNLHVPHQKSIKKRKPNLEVIKSQGKGPCDKSNSASLSSNSQSKKKKKMKISSTAYKGKSSASSNLKFTKKSSREIEHKTKAYSKVKRNKWKKSLGKREKLQVDDISTSSNKSGGVSANWKALLQRMHGGKRVALTRKFTPAHDKESRKSESIQAENKTENEIWFDDVDDALLDKEDEKLKSADALIKADSFKGLTKAVAMDCEMVGVGADGQSSVLARVSIVNQYGHCIYDTFVKPKEKVTDYRTEVSGVRPADLEQGETLQVVQKRVHDITKGRILVGHAINNDLQVLFLDHPRKEIRDTQRFKPFKAMFGGKLPSLKKLTEKVLKVTVQKGEHSSVEDAQATMRLYTMYKKQWEKEIKNRYNKKRKKIKSTKEIN